MKLKFTLLYILVLSFVSGTTQDITGIWRGYFMQAGFDALSGKFSEEQYKYEVQINNLVNDALEGVTYSYFSTQFYGKASLKGIYTKKTKDVLIKETRLVEVKIGQNSVPCLMTCYLSYTKSGNKETLTGTYNSINLKEKSDCGNGTVYLEKVPDTDFELEDFLAKKTTPGGAKMAKPGAESFIRNKKAVTPPANSLAKKEVPKTVTPAPTKPKVTQPVIANKKSMGESPNKKNQVTVPSAKNNTASTTAPKNESPTKQEVTISEQPKNIPETKAPPVNIEQKSTAPVPAILKERANLLVKTLYVSEGEFTIEIYDNGQIDNDTISVYHNNTMVVSHRMLSYKPITIKIPCNSTESRHEFVIVAESLGDIPPNTAIMVITYGKNRQEVFLSTSEEKNAKVVIEYKPGK